MTNSDVRADGARWAKDWLSGNPCEAQFLSGVGKWAVEFAIAAYVAGQANPSPPAMDREAVARIIDPSSWDRNDTYRQIMQSIIDNGDCAQSTVDDIANQRVASSLAKADKIMEMSRGKA